MCSRSGAWLGWRVGRDMHRIVCGCALRSLNRRALAFQGSGDGGAGAGAAGNAAAAGNAGGPHGISRLHVIVETGPHHHAPCTMYHHAPYTSTHLAVRVEVKVSERRIDISTIAGPVVG